jgi:hypothetical protein
MKWKEISTCVSVAVALMCLITIIPVHAAEQHDWQIKQAFGYNCQLNVEVDGWWDPNDGQKGYYRAEHIAVRWANSPVQTLGSLYMYYATARYNNTEPTSADSIDRTLTVSPASVFAQTRGYSMFKNTQTGKVYQLLTDWAIISNWG